MNVNETGFDNLKVIEYNIFKDNRGEFIKTIHKETFEDNELNWRFTESFYSISHVNVLRGMHFQVGLHAHDKLVYVVNGRILDVVLDLRMNSVTFGKVFSIELSQYNRKALFIGKGYAHGFLTLEENTIVEYHTSTSQDKDSERGIKWDSFGFDWPIDNPIMSIKDKNFNKFHQAESFF